MTFKDFLNASRDFEGDSKERTLAEYERNPEIFEQLWEKFQKECDSEFIRMLAKSMYVHYQVVKTISNPEKSFSIEKRFYSDWNQTVVCLKIEKYLQE